MSDLKVDRRWIKKQLNEISEPISAAIIGGGELLATNMNFNSAMKIWIDKSNYQRKNRMERVHIQKKILLKLI